MLEIKAGPFTFVARFEEELAPNTVAQHLVAARRKLGVRTSADAVDAARRAGLLP